MNTGGYTDFDAKIQQNKRTNLLMRDPVRLLFVGQNHADMPYCEADGISP